MEKRRRGNSAWRKETEQIKWLPIKGSEKEIPLSKYTRRVATDEGKFFKAECGHWISFSARKNEHREKECRECTALGRILVED